MKIGRMRRLDYGLWYIGLYVFSYLWMFGIALGKDIDNSPYEFDTFQSLIIFGWVIILLIIYTLMRFYSTIARFHDLGKSGYYSLWTLIPFVSFILIFIKGEVGDNQYGKDPKSK
ncbi:uncharacterized membrane protein YhaH (DUF805 family) [Volucribacter psittacicida]|uniref:Uncharacterized membrane protein YhaH (DUF805 family) n=1 Tax=Volucribacter psittacicida TaxID=203482 RepID=A0A4R1G494_9PAST|nr:DUF805 domain-containing protein [Volucribacter psittacicida]TCJ98441.1 uncharacterized membrane protein YhaH (DUF805 family) [Volucribacter psittacicida]